ncbi:MAG TPA: methyltransferase domain-containing protein [Polyangiaceae bacterium]|nr:methyltransferase domain-containing protein [Polyangiaceae bacterium]
MSSTAKEAVRATPATAACWVCGGPTVRFWTNAAFDAVACRHCGHLLATHERNPSAEQTDYHLMYEQRDFVASLGATRRRQAARLLDALGALPAPPRSLFDFGCGRGFFLQAARERGGLALAGGDVSQLALDGLAAQGLAALPLDAELPFETLDFSRLPFIPEAITFLDVIEHFQGDLGARLDRFVRGLPAAVRFLVFKVPVRDGLLFSLADLARRGGVEGLGRQLFQSGTFPPHYQYFTRRSLDALVVKLGLSTRAVLDDLDFEPAELGRRLSSKGRVIQALAGVCGRSLGAVIRATGRADSRIVIAER